MLKKLFLAAGLAVAAVPASAVPVFNPANGHWYDYVSGSFDLAGAITGAAGATPMTGFDSYLATITSDTENAFIASMLPLQPAWLAGSDADVEGVWRWVAGPEAGQIFFGPGAPAGAYTHWNTNEPNSFLGFEEDGLQTNHIFAGGWNDVGVGTPLGYVVEYSNSAVPEASTWAMMLLGFVAMGFALRGTPGRRGLVSA